MKKAPEPAKRKQFIEYEVDENTRPERINLTALWVTAFILACILLITFIMFFDDRAVDTVEPEQQQSGTRQSVIAGVSSP